MPILSIENFPNLIFFLYYFGGPTCSVSDEVLVGLRVLVGISVGEFVGAKVVTVDDGKVILPDRNSTKTDNTHTPRITLLPIM